MQSCCESPNYETLQISMLVLYETEYPQLLLKTCIVHVFRSRSEFERAEERPVSPPEQVLPTSLSLRVGDKIPAGVSSPVPLQQRAVPFFHVIYIDFGCSPTGYTGTVLVGAVSIRQAPAAASCSVSECGAATGAKLRPI